MIPASPAPRQTPAWQRALARAIQTPEALYQAVGLDPATLPACRAAHRDFPLRVPLGYVARMRPGDPHDPLLRQVLPLGVELDRVDGFVTDPVGDLAASPAQGLLHKYAGRALLITTPACAIHCRYCFRRHFPYREHTGAKLQPAVDAIRADAGIREVILSGGDPLSLADHRLADLESRLRAIPHVQRLRLHTRLPVVLPERVDAALLAWLGASPLQKVVVIHANHAHEIDAAVVDALAHLKDAGCTLLNQAVLLRGINDDLNAQIALAETLFAAGVLPYYLHQLDRVQGAAHFEVDDTRALALVDELGRHLPGYLVPRLVREVPGAPAKTPLHTLRVG